MISFQSLLPRDRKTSAHILLLITKNLVSLMWYRSGTSYFYFPVGGAPVILQIPCTVAKLLKVKKSCFTLHHKTLCWIPVLKIQGRILPLVLHGIKVAFCSVSQNGRIFSELWDLSLFLLLVLK